MGNRQKGGALTGQVYFESHPDGSIQANPDYDSRSCDLFAAIGKI